jgi:hypothetical protein
MSSSRPYSGALRKGLSESLALFSANLQALETTSAEMRTRFVGNAVRTLLKDATAERWMDLDYLMPTLAEAGPLEFLEAVEKGLDAESKPFEIVFEHGKGPFGGSHHTGLLWALETLSWIKEYFPRATACLARLASIDPGGNVANRPLNSLTAILLPWLPQTTATDESRRQSVGRIAELEKDVAWKLILSLLPQGPSSSWPTRKPEWRWKDQVPSDKSKGVPINQYWADVAYYGATALELAGSDASRLAVLAGRYFHMQAEFRTAYRERLSSMEVRSLNSEHRLELWTALAQLTTSHRRHSDSPQWRVPEDALLELEGIADALEPKENPFVMHGRLFGGSYAMAMIYEGDWHQRRDVLAMKQQEALNELLNLDRNKLFDFATSVDSPREVGVALANLDRTSYDTRILRLLSEPEGSKMLQFATGYVMGAQTSGGQEWLSAINLDELDTLQRARLLSILPFGDATWVLVDKWLGEHASAYWTIVDPRWIVQSSDLSYALRKLLEFSRPSAAINCMQVMVWDKLELRSELIIEALKALDPKDRTPEHEIAELIKRLQDDLGVAREDVALIEWKYIDLLGDYHQAKPRVLSDKLAHDAKFFCQVLGYVYRSDKVADKESKQLTKEEAENAHKGYSLLSAWRQPPGANQDGTMDKDVLTEWLKKVKASTTQSGHWSMAMGQIGEVFFYGPKDDRGLWLEPMCKILDARGHDRMRSSLTTEVYNDRGIHSPSKGQQELAIAADWQRIADLARQKGYARLSSALEGFAQQYRDEAAIEAEDDPFW